MYKCSELLIYLLIKDLTELSYNMLHNYQASLCVLYQVVGCSSNRRWVWSWHHATWFYYETWTISAISYICTTANWI